MSLTKEQKETINKEIINLKKELKCLELDCDRFYKEKDEVEKNIKKSQDKFDDIERRIKRLKCH